MASNQYPAAAFAGNEFQQGGTLTIRGHRPKELPESTWASFGMTWGNFGVEFGRQFVGLKVDTGGKWVAAFGPTSVTLRMDIRQTLNQL